MASLTNKNGVKRFGKTSKRKPTFDSASEKFESLFGNTNVGLTKQPDKAHLFASPMPFEKKTRSPKKNVYSSKPKKTKYEQLFEENEKKLSDKFDMVFNDEDSPVKAQIKSDKPLMATFVKSDEDNTSEKSNLKNSKSPSNFDQVVSEKTTPNKKNASDMFDEMLKEESFFNTSPLKSKPVLHKINAQTIGRNALIDNSHSTSVNKSESVLLSPSKKSNISHATMKKIGGNVVVNIHRRQSSVKSKPPTSTALIAKTFEQNTEEFKKLTSSFNKPTVSKSRQNEQMNPVAAIPSITLKKEKTVLPMDSYSTNSVTVFSTTQSNNQIKSKKLLAVTKKTKNVSYNPRPWVDVLSSNNDSAIDEDLAVTEQDVALTRSATWPQEHNMISEKQVTSIKCDRNTKQVFTVVQHIKNYQNCLEEGEMIEFKGDFLYLKSGISLTQPLNIRCQSTVAFARKCLSPNFRLYIRALNALPTFFDLLEDAPNFPILSNCVALLLFVLSRDRQIDISKKILNLLIQIVDPFNKMKKTVEQVIPKVEDKTSNKYRIFKSRNKDGGAATDAAVVQKNIAEVIEETKDPIITKEQVDIKTLASEALIRFTVHRKSDWFKEELRLKGGIDHFIFLVNSAIDQVEELRSISFDGTPSADDARLKCHALPKVMQALHSAIQESPRSAMYLVTHQRALLLRKVSNLLHTCGNWLKHFSHEDKALVELLDKVMEKIMMLLHVISSDNEWASTRIGEQDGLLKNILECCLEYSEYLPKEKKCNMMTMSLGLLANLLDSSPNNRILFKSMKTKPYRKRAEFSIDEEVLAIQAFIQLFLSMEENAVENEILGEKGVRRKVQELQDGGSQPSSSQQSVSNDIGRMVETDEGLMWVADDDDLSTCSQDTIPLSQEIAMPTDIKKVEANLTAEQKNEMNDAINKANEHMEASMIAAYVALALGCIVRGNRLNARIICSFLPNNGDLSSMITMLKKFQSFMNITDGMSKQGEKSLQEVIQLMEEINLENGF